MPGSDGKYPYESWNELKMLDPLKRFARKEALEIMVDGDADVFHFSSRLSIFLKTPLLRSTIPFLLDELDGRSSSCMSRASRNTLKPGLQNSGSADSLFGDPWRQIHWVSKAMRMVSYDQSETMVLSPYFVSISARLIISNFLLLIYTTVKSTWIDSLESSLTCVSDILTLCFGRPVDVQISQT